MGSCLSLRLWPSRYLQHQERLHQGNTFSHYSLAGSRQDSRVSCVELYPSFGELEDNSSLNLSDVDAATCGSCHSCHSCCCSGSSGSIPASASMMGLASFSNKRASLADRWSQIVLEESELDAAVMPEIAKQQQRKSPKIVAAATAWSLSPSPRLDHRATVAELSGVGFGYEQFEVMDRLVGGEEEADSHTAGGLTARRSGGGESSPSSGLPIWRSIRRRLEVLFVRSKGASETLS